MNLTIDIGNSRTKLGVFSPDELIHREVVASISVRSLQELSYNQNIENVILSSVASVPGEVEAFLKSNFFYLPLCTETPLPIRLRYKTPETLGKDRVAAVAGAWHHYPGENCLVIDAGTCITCDVLSAEGEFLGGNIAPGIDMRLKAMHHFTARLPEVSRSGNAVAGLLGLTTEDALRNGGQLGALLEMEAFIRACEQYFGPMKVVLTGGDADYFVKNIKTKIFAHPNLVLAGLNKILNHNVEILSGR
ncbi:MAG: type III pantothenate kinase [Saprospiraceae bacterium]